MLHVKQLHKLNVTQTEFYEHIYTVYQIWFSKFCIPETMVTNQMLEYSYPVIGCINQSLQ